MYMHIVYTYIYMYTERYVYLSAFEQDKELRFPNKETHILALQKGMLSCVTRRQASKDEKNLPPSMARKNTQTRIMETHKTLGEETYPHRKHDGGEHSK